MTPAHGPRERNLSRLQLMAILGLGALLSLVLGYFFFVSSTLLPALQAHKEADAALTAAEKELLAALRARDEEMLHRQLALAQARLDQAAAAFLTESQAAWIMDLIYQDAYQSGVDIIDLQSQTQDAQGDKRVYNARTFVFQGQAWYPNLVDFVRRVHEDVTTTTVLSGVEILRDAEQYLLSLEITLYSLPFTVTAGGDATSAGAQELERLNAALDEAWVSGDWARAIALTNRLLALGPESSATMDKLYSAYVNYGYELLNEGKTAAAATQFESALRINPQGEEALKGVSATSATAIPSLTFEEQLTHSLDTAWSQENWPLVIQVIQEILARDPGNGEMTGKLYAAYVNYGYQLAGRDQLAEAREAFVHATEINPQGQEAADGLRALSEGSLPGAEPTAAPASTIYTVQPGDTLSSIAQEFGTSVETIMAANGLSDENIRVGQTLQIPANP
jgi:LysM repeat protein